MGWVIRLVRAGSGNRPIYNIRAVNKDEVQVVQLGVYNRSMPKTSKHRLVCDLDKLAELRRDGAKISPPVKKMLGEVARGHTRARHEPVSG